MTTRAAQDPIEPRPAAAGRLRAEARAEDAALRLIDRHGGAIMRTARRYSRTAEDAEDAYQRGLEILLRKAPSAHERDLVPWLKTVVKHEAFAIRRQRDRFALGFGVSPADDGPALGAGTEEEAERRERLRLGAEAMRALKPQEVRCLLLRAEGLSYRQICEETGWTYTKVNRCITEGRRSFAERISRIESGEECRRLAPLLDALLDAEERPDDLAALRRHLRGCGACRATLRERRFAPGPAAALLPPALLSLPLPPGLEEALGFASERLAAAAERLRGAWRALSAHKAAAAATVAVAAGGLAAGAAATGDPDPPARPVAATAAPSAPAAAAAAPERPARQARRRPSSRPRPRPHRLRRRAESRRAAGAAPARREVAPAPAAGREAPGAGLPAPAPSPGAASPPSAPRSSPPPAPAAAPGPASGAPAPSAPARPSPSGGGGTGGGGSEFGP